MRLGADLHPDQPDPERWGAKIRELGLRAVVWPLDGEVDARDRKAWVVAATAADATIAEVGAWCNPLHPNDELRVENVRRCEERLALADELGANCCVNVGGSAGEEWWGPHPRDLDEDRFDLVVETVRAIVDAVKPTRTAYALETMPWMHPDSADSYLRLVEAVDRPGFGVHLDPVNLINSPRRYFANGGIIRECFGKLGPWIRSCHAKDVKLEKSLTVHLREVPPGQGGLDYRAFVDCLWRLDPEVPVIVEHVATDELPAALAHIRKIESEAPREATW